MTRGTAAAEKVLEELERAYAKASKELQGDIRRLYEKYSNEYGLSYADAIKYIDASDFKEWRFTLEEYVERIRATGDMELLRELDTLSTRSRVTRLQTLETAIEVNTTELGQKGEELVTQLLSDTYENTYYRAAYDFQRGVGVGSTLEMLSPAEVAKAIAYPWSGADYSTRIWRNAETLTAALQDTLTQGLIQGKDIRQMTAAIQDATGSGVYNAQRLVRTETAYMVEAAELRSYADCGVERYEILVSLDERTCKKCGPRDGQKHAVADAKVADNYPPFHSNCRCTTVASFDDDEGGVRFARDKAGKGIEVPADMTYNEWFDQYVKGDPEYLAKVKATQNKAADMKQFEWYRQLLGTDAPKSFEGFQKLKYNNTDNWNFMKLDYSRRKDLFDHPEKVLPHANEAIAADEKFTRYLFNPESKRGSSKGQAFTSRLGYSIDNWEGLREQILQRAPQYPATFVDETQFGRKYGQKIIIYGSKGKPANVVVGWIEEGGRIKMTTALIKEV